MLLSNLQKLLITAYTEPDFSETSRDDQFMVMLNPETYAQSYQVNFADDQTPGSDGGELIFDSISPIKMTFEFLFDRTGAIPVHGLVMPDGVHGDIERFKKISIGYEGDQHRTKYLRLTWGKLNFKCCITTLSVSYKLFRPDGTPIRAIISATFEEFKEVEQRVNEQNDQSPDLTHQRIVHRGDTLPWMAYKIYGDSKYYLEVAKANGIVDFRNLNVGDKIYFPPIEK